MHPVMLRAPCADDDDRRPDPLRARGLDHAPSVLAGQHQVEHADIGLLVPETGEPELSRGHQEGLEARGGEVLGHPLADHVVVLEDEDSGHRHVNNGGCAIRLGALVVSNW